jgi:predicted nucleic acid-binding protein
VRAVLDANVLFPFTLRDTLLRAAGEACFQAYWSERILDEATRNLVETGEMTSKQAARLRAVMEQAFPEAMVRGHERLIGAMRNDEKDRHVAAAAVKAKAEVIVTSNVRDFRHLPSGIEAMRPDEFLVGLFDASPDAILRVLQEQAADLRRPPMTVENLLGRLERVTPNFVDLVRAKLGRAGR